MCNMACKNALCMQLGGPKKSKTGGRSRVESTPLNRRLHADLSTSQFGLE